MSFVCPSLLIRALLFPQDIFHHPMRLERQRIWKVCDKYQAWACLALVSAAQHNADISGDDDRQPQESLSNSVSIVLMLTVMMTNTPRKSRLVRFSRWPPAHTELSSYYPCAWLRSRSVYISATSLVGLDQWIVDTLHQHFSGTSSSQTWTELKRCLHGIASFKWPTTQQIQKSNYINICKDRRWNVGKFDGHTGYPKKLPFKNVNRTNLYDTS